MHKVTTAKKKRLKLADWGVACDAAEEKGLHTLDPNSRVYPRYIRRVSDSVRDYLKTRLKSRWYKGMLYLRKRPFWRNTGHIDGFHPDALKFVLQFLGLSLTTYSSFVRGSVLEYIVTGSSGGK